MDAEDEYLAVFSRAERRQSRFQRVSGAAVMSAAKWMRRLNGEVAQASHPTGMALPPVMTGRRPEPSDHRNAATLLGLREIAARLDGGVHPGD